MHTCAGGDVNGLEYSSKFTRDVISLNAGGRTEILLQDMSNLIKFFNLLISVTEHEKLLKGNKLS